MSNEIPKNANLAESVESLANNDKLQELKLQNKISKELIEIKNNEKKENDAEAILHNAKILNSLSKNLVKIFFSSYFFLWVAFYIILNVVLDYYYKDKAYFYISLLDKVVLFVIVCVLGKFLKDNLSLFIEMLRKDKT